MQDERRAGMLKVSLEFLADLLKLPAGHSIVDLRLGGGIFPVAELMIEGPSLPVFDRQAGTPDVRLIAEVRTISTHFEVVAPFVPPAEG